MLDSSVVASMFIAGVALATRFDSDLKLYPKSERATQLAEWALSNTIQIKATILQEDYHDSASKLFDLKPEPIVPITDMLHVSGQVCYIMILTYDPFYITFSSYSCLAYVLWNTINTNK
ncbi:unnamed protein product [Cuscuta epithymum]|uniref:Uncharacterized protein n=1 Tax=Cuscuta epithymum TaxID=186058 RepID=A0AAV0DAG8_9ASTE|nr:unnamed protein product [Cuscuta epithymum]